MPLLKGMFCLVVVVLAFGVETYAQPFRILMVETMPVQVVLDHEKYFLNGMQELGYRTGENIVVDKIEAQGDAEHAKKELNGYLSHKKPDIVVSFATLASQAAKEALAGTNIPLVFCVVSDPVGAGLIGAVGKPTKSNITGLVFSLMRQSKVDLAQELLTQPFPDRTVRAGVVFSSYPAAVYELERMNAIMKLGGKIELKAFQLEYRAMPDGLEAMLADAVKGIAELSPNIDYWWVVPGPLGESIEFSTMLLESKVPVGLCHTQACTEAGGLFFVNPNYEKSGHQVASIVDSILKGNFPGSIPPVPPDSFDFGVNLKTAIELGIVVPSELLELAGDNTWR